MPFTFANWFVVPDCLHDQVLSTFAHRHDHHVLSLLDRPALLALFAQ